MRLTLEEEAAIAYSALSRLLNNYSYHRQVEIMLKQLRQDHPSLQQNFWRMIFGMIYEYAKTEDYDERNEGAVEACRKLVDIVEDCLFHFPTI